MSWTCPKCDRELPWPEYRNYCARVSLDSLFEGRSPGWYSYSIRSWPKSRTGKECWPVQRRIALFYPPGWLPDHRADEKGTGSEILFQRSAPGKTGDQKCRVRKEVRKSYPRCRAG